MIEIIEKLEVLGFRVCIYPVYYQNKNWYWRAGVYIGNNTHGTWIDSDNGLPHATYVSYKEALKAIVDFVKKYKSNGTNKAKVS